MSYEIVPNDFNDKEIFVHQSVDGGSVLIGTFNGDNAKHNAAIFIAALKMKEKHGEVA